MLARLQTLVAALTIIGGFFAVPLSACASVEVRDFNPCSDTATFVGQTGGTSHDGEYDRIKVDDDDFSGMKSVGESESFGGSMPPAISPQLWRHVKNCPMWIAHAKRQVHAWYLHYLLLRPPQMSTATVAVAV